MSNNNKVGKKTPVFKNMLTGEVICGPNLNEALGVGFSYTPSKDWVEVHTLDKKERVCISDGTLLPRNMFNELIVETVDSLGPKSITIGSRTITVNVIHQDALRVIISE